MPNVKKIKTSIGQDDFVSSRTPLPDLLCQFRSRENLLSGQSSLHYGAQQFSASYGGGTAFHHHDASGVVRQTRGGFRIGPGSKRGCVGSDNGIPRSCNVSHFVRTINRDCHWLVAAREDHHAVSAARYQQRLQFHFLHHDLAGGEEPSIVIADSCAQNLFQL